MAEMYLRTRAGKVGACLTLALAACGDAPPDMTPVPTPMIGAAPDAYTTKVKNLLTGQAPTNNELVAVNADPKMLPTLISQWMMQPEFKGKMAAFFTQAFQQTQLAVNQFDEQLGHTTNPWNGLDKAYFLYSQEVSFPLTALQLIDEGRPFTEVATTQRYMLNPPLMAFLAYNDAVPVDDAAVSSSGWIPQKYPQFKYTRQKDTVIPLSQTLDPTSPNFMTWYDPKPYTGLNANCLKYPLTIDPMMVPVAKREQAYLAALTESMDMIFGGRPGCGSTTSQFTIADWSAWRMVTVRAPKAGEDRTAFYDLTKFRDPKVTELVLATPRAGFMTTPAFFANWDTNVSNLARVTTNQALIVALGTSIANPNAAVPVTETGKPDAAHVDPSTPCYGCHRVLDPMRNFYRQSFTLSFHQQLGTLPLEQQSAEFIVDPADVKGTGIKDLAAAMAAHPRFATAWAQKLCRYANSSDCAADDPEFLRVADVFTKSNYDFKALVRELFSSPLVTQATETKTADELGLVISISRREHLCAALSGRLGIPDACSLLTLKSSTIQNLAFGIPGSGYSRGAEAPLLPHDPDLFFTSATENLCAQMAALVVDPASCKTGQKCYSSKNGAAAVQDLVQTLMAMPPSDPQAAAGARVLSDHLAAAGMSGLSPTDALKSTFVLACASPFFISSGL